DPLGIRGPGAAAPDHHNECCRFQTASIDLNRQSGLIGSPLASLDSPASSGQLTLRPLTMRRALRRQRAADNRHILSTVMRFLFHPKSCLPSPASQVLHPPRARVFFPLTPMTSFLPTQARKLSIPACAGFVKWAYQPNEMVSARL